MIDSEPDGRADDRALVDRIADGDRSALAVLYGRYASTLLGVAVRILGGRREAEDLVHDVFLEAWRRAGSYRPERGSVRTWLLLRLRSRALDRVRSPRLKRAVSLESTMPDYAERRAAPDDPSIAADRARVRAAVARLPQPQRAVLLLAYFEGRSSTEIADRLELPVGTVKSRLAAARRGLRAALEVEAA